MRLKRKSILIIAVLTVAALAVGFYMLNSDGQKIYYRTAQINRGDLSVTIGATGTVEPEEVIDVGAQVAGKINSFGADKDGKEVDYGSVVEEGTVLAQIDDSLYTADVAQATAQLMQAQAGVQRATADLEQLKAKLYQAQRDWGRAQKLGPSEALAQSSFDAYKSAYETAKANVDVGQSAIEQSKAAVLQAQAVLQRSQRNLGYCTIKSPVKGVIIDRRVNIGQTVVASLNAPSLFLLAKDLKRMQVWVSVNEADIGNIKEGQAVEFTVDAYPNEIFHGQVGKIRLNATMTQNVVTYTVEVITDNSSGRLLPYLTANVLFKIDKKENVLIVPNISLRWVPEQHWIAPEFRDSAEKNSHNIGSKNHQNGSKIENYRIIWIPEGNYVRPLKVQVGLTDGTVTEIESDQIEEGMQVVTGQEEKPVEPAANPFTPQFKGGRFR